MGKSKLITIVVLVVMIMGVAITAGVLMGNPDADTSSDEPKDYSRQMNVEDVDVSRFIDEEADITLGEFYKQDGSADEEDESNSNSMYIHFTNDEEYILYYGSSEAIEGTYTVEGNHVVLSSEDVDGTVMTFICNDNGQLMTESCICRGEIPEEETFNLKVVQKGNTDTYYYKFKKDGTFKLTDYSKGTGDSGDRKYEVEGTYVKTDDSLQLLTENVDFVPYLIYQNTLVTGYYEEITGDQFEEEYAANQAEAEAAQSSSAASSDSTENTESTEN